MKSWYCVNSSTDEAFSLKMPSNGISAPLCMETFPLMSVRTDDNHVLVKACHSSVITSCLAPPWVKHSHSAPVTSLSHVQYLFCSQSFRWTWSRRCTVLSSLQRPSVIAGPSLFDAADWTGFVCCSCPRLCQIKGQRLDSEATLLFILVQPRERSNKSRRNVVTREAERSLPTGRGNGEKLSH